MNLCFLAPIGAIGGLEIEIVKKAVSAVNLGHKAHIICLEGTPIEQLAKSQNIDTYSISFRTPYIAPLASFKISRILKKTATDVLISAKTNLLGLAVFAKKLYGGKYKIVLYQQMISGLNKKDFYHNLIYNNTDGAVVLAEYMRHLLKDSTVFPFEKTTAISPGVDLSLFSPEKHNKAELRKKYGLPEDKTIFGIIGRIEMLKGQDYALEGFAKADMDNSFLVIAGNVGDNDFFEKLNTIIDKYKIRKKIKFLPFTWQVHEMQNCLDVFIMPSLCETFGYVNTEALASGNPVIGADAGGVPEIIQHNYNGLLYDPRDPDTLASHIKLVTSNKEFYEKLRENALKTAGEKYVKEIQDKRFFDFCESVVLRKGQS